MLPALDMLNHTRVAERRNSSLQQSHDAMTVRRGDADVTFTGSFSMAAGKQHSACPSSGLRLVPACRFKGLAGMHALCEEERGCIKSSGGGFIFFKVNQCEGS